MAEYGTIVMPRPLATIDLMISTFSVSMTTFTGIASSTKNWSTTRRVFEPLSKRMSGWRASARASTERRRANLADDHPCRPSDDAQVDLLVLRTEFPQELRQDMQTDCHAAAERE